MTTTYKQNTRKRTITHSSGYWTWFGENKFLYKAWSRK